SNQNCRCDGDRHADLLHDQFLSRERVFRFYPLIALRATILPRSGASPERLSLRPRRFPPPWSAEVTPNCFIVRDANGQQLAYVYYESEPGWRSAAKLLTKDEARRVAVNIAKLPELSGGHTARSQSAIQCLPVKVRQAETNRAAI